MQAMLPEAKAAWAPIEPDLVRSFRGNPQIRSVTIIRKPKRETPSAGHLERPAGITTPNSLKVTDPLMGYSYILTQKGPVYQLLFENEEEQLTVTVLADANITQIAHEIATQLETLKASS